ncbi:GlcG/HbpS family heme-binding protein [Bartonella tamiae]|uniref:Heme-binding protein n=1 Tax=Bartonella tamiae Th239 TaxID=1094558 RepID=J1K0R7_9HYPH|nr:heme-binding protein [Bartonella tamiae]EJF90635.1 hypothetical protein ME5_01036 [Bartonella tamiae Th239]EJF93988.1 hypothetical protein MEG_00846 [Bartonella tamiae Th307]
MINFIKKLLILSAILMIFSHNAFAEYAVQTLALEDARNLIDTGQKNAKVQKVNICIAVVDPSGNLIAFERMDHARYGCIETAVAKARAAALYRIKTSVNMQRVNGNEAAVGYLPHMMPLGGGVPIISKNVMVGAVGVSGATNPAEVKLAEQMASSYVATPDP